MEKQDFKEGDMMFRTRRLNYPPPVPYCAKFGVRGGFRIAKPETSVVDFSFVRDRDAPPPNPYWDPSPKLIERMLTLIRYE